jgi:phosphoglycerate dehydrogenase-like enzyme
MTRVATLLLAFKKHEFCDADVSMVQQRARGLRVVRADDRAQIETVLDDVEIAAGEVPYDLIVRAPCLRWFQQWSAGANWLMRYPEAVERPFVLTNASGVHAIPISEHILGFLLAFARSLPAAWRAQQSHRWESQRAVFELAGKVLLLVGVGAIGQRTAHVAAGLGMRVWGIRRNPGAIVPDVEKMGAPVDLLAWLPQADFVVLTVPLTPQTLHGFGEAQLRSMKPSSYLVNIGRGKTVDETALITALREGWIAGAGLDVVDTEPLPPDSPLWDMPHVLITAHYAGGTPAYNQRGMEIFLDNLDRYLSGQPMRNVVDKRLGY